MSKVVIGAFDDPSEVGQVTNALAQAGVPLNNIRVIGNHAGSAQYSGSADLVTPLRRFGVSEQEAHHYAEVVRRGGTLVAAITPDDSVPRVRQAMDSTHSGIDLDERVGRYQQSGYTRFDANAPAFTADQAHAEREQYRIPIVEEQLTVGKREVERGRVRIVSRVVEVPVEEQVTLREEHATVERHAVNRPVAQADLNALRDNTVEVTEHAEVPVVAKQARVVEEVVIGKQATEHTETIRDTVRRSEVDVDLDENEATLPTHRTTGVTPHR